METEARPAAMKRLFLIINSILLSVGSCAGPLIMRLYFIHGGKSIWLSSWLQTGGFVVILIPLLVDFSRRRSQIFSMKPRLFIYAAAIGLLTGIDNYLYAYGVAKLPVSTSSLIIATQLGFTAVFAFFLVNQKFTPYSINAAVLLTVGASLLALHASSDKPKGESTKEYMLGFILTLIASALYGLFLPLVELAYLKANQAITYTLVLEFQLVLCVSATAFCTVGMLVIGDFQKIPVEARGFELGAVKYYTVVVLSAVIWQLYFVGIVGVIFYSSAFFSSVLMTFLLPPTEILAVVFLHENFQVEKGVSLFLSLWGFVSYSYGELLLLRRHKKMAVELSGSSPAAVSDPPITTPP